jgi:hypothetical protein
MKICPTCRRPLPDLAAEKAYEAALREHSRLLERLAPDLDHTAFLELEVAAGMIMVATEAAIGARLRRLRPELADLTDLATGRIDADWWVMRQPWEGKEVDAEEDAP